MTRDSHSPSRGAKSVALAAALLAAIGTSAHAEEFGTGPWPKGYTDIFSGILPPVPGIYIRNDAYHYDIEVAQEGRRLKPALLRNIGSCLTDQQS